jgi:hypothetical protein
MLMRVAGLPLDVHGYKKSETEEIYIHPKLTEKKKKTKGQLEDFPQKEYVKVWASMLQVAECLCTLL